MRGLVARRIFLLAIGVILISGPAAAQQTGILSGIVGSRVISAKLSWPTLISADSIVIAFVVSAVIGIFFGFYPAHKAAELDPIDALRYE